jgi:hypothetical protein
VITLFCVRPRGFNIGNDTIFFGLRHLLRETFDGRLNIVQVPAASAAGELGGLKARAVHEMNLYGHGVVIGGGNLYENGQLDVDTNALRALRPPLMLFSLSHGRIYDNRHQLVRRSDSMPDDLVIALNAHAALSIARDDATLAHLRALNLDTPVLGGCPSMLLREIAQPAEAAPLDGCLLSLRHPRLMSIPLADQAHLHGKIVDLIAAMNADGFGPVRILCHDVRDVAFASTFADVEYILSDDVYSHLALLRNARLVVTFRLHAFLPCLAFGTPAINVSYDERSRSLVRTIGMESWDIDLIRSDDVVSEVRERCTRLHELAELRAAAQPQWVQLTKTMRDQMASFAALVNAYASQGPS